MPEVCKSHKKLWEGVGKEKIERLSGLALRVMTSESLWLLFS